VHEQLREQRVFGLAARHWPAFAAAVAALFLSVLLVALTGLWTSTHRAPTGAELRRAADLEVARRWRSWPIGRIFPEQVAYSVVGETEYARRVGISPATGCADAVDTALRPVLADRGCEAVLRATYIDQLQGVVVTVGVAAFKDEWSAYRARIDLPDMGQQSGLRALPIARTPAALFDDAARQFGTTERAGPYIVFTAAGQTDGRPAQRVSAPRAGVFDAVPQLGHSVGLTLAQRALPNCKSREWQC
jgi:hypothetical protein